MSSHEPDFSKLTPPKQFNIDEIEEVCRQMLAGNMQCYELKVTHATNDLKRFDLTVQGYYKTKEPDLSSRDEK